MPETLNGATRVYFIVGDPITQVKSPYGVSQDLQARGRNALVLPAHVAPAALAAWLAGVSLAQNVDGIIVTVPHKLACVELCRTRSERSEFLGAVNVLRRNADGSWHGDMFDGLAFVAALQANGCQLEGKTALLAGAGGAGSAIAHALVLAGVAALAIHDDDAVRRTRLVARLASLGQATVTPASLTQGRADPTGFDVLVNATPMGMKDSDPLPLLAHKLQARQFVGCVITAPAVTPLVAAARARGCHTSTGTDMFGAVRGLMVDFLLGA